MQRRIVLAVLAAFAFVSPTVILAPVMAAYTTVYNPTGSEETISHILDEVYVGGAQSSFTPEDSQNTGSYTWASAELASLGREFSQPPQSPTGSLDHQSNGVRPLPAVPATALMLLSGFLCVSLYRDRKIWLMGLMGILWVGQAGIQTIPRLAHHFDHKRTKKQICAKQTQSPCLKDYKISPSDIKRTKYIGLLHYLAGLPKAKSRSNLLHITPQAVVQNQDNPALLLVCPARAAEQFTCFSPAFIFNNLSRGPPVLS
jgi:hypothetical protein